MPDTSSHPLEQLAATGPWGGPSYRCRGADIHSCRCRPGANMQAMALLFRSNAGKPWTSEELDALRRMASAGATKNEIADQLGRTIVSVTSRAEKLQVSIREGSGVRKLRRRGELCDPE